LTDAEENSRLSGILEAAPFPEYFAVMVYDRMPRSAAGTDVPARYREAAEAGQVTEKGPALRRSAPFRYGSNEFSARQPERDFDSAAYAAIRSFVPGFRSAGLLESAVYGKRVRYRIRPQYGRGQQPDHLRSFHDRLRNRRTGDTGRTPGIPERSKSRSRITAAERRGRNNGSPALSGMTGTRASTTCSGKE